MKILFLTDIHQNKDVMEKIIFNKYDRVLCGGDILDPVSPDMKKAKEIIDLLPGDTYIIPGNCDTSPELIEYMKSKLNYIDKKTVFLDEKTPLLGLGYCRNLAKDLKNYRKYFLEDKNRVLTFYKKSPLKFILKYCGIETDGTNINILSDEEAVQVAKDYVAKFQYFKSDEIKELMKTTSTLRGGILMTHSPPFGFIDKLPGLPHIGSKTIYKVLKDKVPRLVLCGHFHELYSTTYYKNTLIFNPGAAKDSRIGIIKFSNDLINVKSYKIQD